MILVFVQICNDQTVVPPELAVVGFSEKVVYLAHTYQANDYNVTDAFCGGETLDDCQASVRYVQAPSRSTKLEVDWGCISSSATDRVQKE